QLWRRREQEAPDRQAARDLRARGEGVPTGSGLADRVPRRGPVLAEELEDRQDECRRLARARLGAREEVAPRENVGDGLGMDGRRLGVALARNGAKELGREPEAFE